MHDDHCRRGRGLARLASASATGYGAALTRSTVWDLLGSSSSHVGTAASRRVRRGSTGSALHVLRGPLRGHLPPLSIWVISVACAGATQKPSRSQLSLARAGPRRGLALFCSGGVLWCGMMGLRLPHGTPSCELIIVDCEQEEGLLCELLYLLPLWSHGHSFVGYVGRIGGLFRRACRCSSLSSSWITNVVIPSIRLSY